MNALQEEQFIIQILPFGIWNLEFELKNYHSVFGRVNRERGERGWTGMFRETSK